MSAICCHSDSSTSALRIRTERRLRGVDGRVVRPCGHQERVPGTVEREGRQVHAVVVRPRPRTVDGDDASGRTVTDAVVAIQTWGEIKQDFGANWLIFLSMPLVAAFVGWSTKIV